MTEAATIYNVIPGSTPDGRVMLYLNRGAAETTFTLAEAGLCRLEFFAAARTGAANLWIEVYVDGVLLNRAQTPFAFVDYDLYEAIKPAVAAR